MFIEVGHFSLKLALLFSLAHILMAVCGSFTRLLLTVRWTVFLTSGVLLLVVVAFSCLLQAYVSSDFSVANVAQNSHLSLPLIFKIAGIWGNHEGSILLFVLILSLFTWALACLGRRDHEFFFLALSSQHTIISAVLLFILLTSNPFLPVANLPTQGADLNPLLQDIGLILHPPLLYFGIVGFSVAFSFAIAALIVGRCDAELGNVIRPWLLFSWSFLTVGITVGSYWAYYELGWGGYWFWDPVENASLMPWLSACALIHSARILAKRGALKLWTLLLSIVTFSLSLLGTFLVRADLLISVHNFASIPERSLAILLMVIFFSGGALLLFALRAPRIEAVNHFSPWSREGVLTLNNVFLGTACASVLIGTLYPMMMEALWSEKISVGPPFFNWIFACLMLPMLILMPLGPLLGWKHADLAISLERLGLAIAASLAVIITMLVLQERRTLFSLMVAATLGLACWLIVGALCDLLTHSGLFYHGRSSGRYRLAVALRRLISLPLGHYGRFLAHSGVGITLAGIVAVSAFSHETITSVQRGQGFTLNGKILRFDRIIPHLGANYFEDRLEFTLWDETRQFAIGSLYPARRFFPTRNMETSEVGLLWHGLSQYYVAAGHFDAHGGLVVQAWYKSYVLAIWLGGFFMAAGGFLALWDRGKARGNKRNV